MEWGLPNKLLTSMFCLVSPQSLSLGPWLITAPLHHPTPSPMGSTGLCGKRAELSQGGLESDMGVGTAREGDGGGRETKYRKQARGQGEAVGAEKEASSSLNLPPTHPSHLSYVKSLPLEEGVPGRVGEK